MSCIKVLMIGNANTGKSTIFNELTKSNRHTGNWYGVTVSGAQKAFIYKDQKIILEDLPGIYSLKMAGAEEQVTLNRLKSNDYDVVLNVCEARALSRNLYLSMQLRALGVNMIIAVNMADEQKDFIIDYNLMSQKLGVPVVSISAKKKTNLDVLCDMILSAGVYKKTSCKVQDIDNIIQILDTQKTYEQIDELMSKIKSKKPLKKIDADKIILSPILSLPIFALIMTAVFFVTFELAGSFLSDILRQGLEVLSKRIETGLVKTGATIGFRKLVCEAILGGAASVIEFLPQIAVLFLCLFILEDSGYMARAAYILDGAFQKIGLNGRAAYTLLMGFGCSASAVFTSKSIEQPSVRLKTVMITPFMSCSARMPVFLAIAGVFFKKNTYLVITSLYLGGIITACLVAILLNKILKIDVKENDFFVELPPYRFPSFKRVFKSVIQEVKNFFIRICTVLFLVNIIVWILASFNWTFRYVGLSGNSILKNISKFLLPIFYPLGITKWQAVSALLSGFVAKETVVSVITTLGGINAIFTSSSQAFSFLVFVLLYTPCVATIAAISRELGKKWAIISILMHTITAYIISMLVFGLTILFTILSPNAIIIPACIIIMLLMFRTAFMFNNQKLIKKQ